MKHRFVTTALLITFVLSFSIVGVVPVHAAGILYVKPAAAGAGDCSSWANACTLQTALTNSVSGDQIWVAAGTYKPTTTNDRTATFLLKNGVEVYGSFPATGNPGYGDRDLTANIAILSGDIDNNDANADGNNIAETEADVVGNNSYHVVTGVTGATLDGFIITAGKADSGEAYDGGGGMINKNCNPRVTHTTFSGNTGIGMYNYQSSPTLAYVNFIGNADSGMTNLLSSPMITNATFDNNFYIGIANRGTSDSNINPVLTNVTIKNTRVEYVFGMPMASFGMQDVYSNSVLENVTVTGNARIGLSFQSGSPVLKHVTVSNNADGGINYEFYDTAKDISAGYHLTISASIISGNRVIYGGNPDLDTFLGPPVTLSNSVLGGACDWWVTCSNVTTSDPQFGVLAYGNFTQVLPLLPGSSAYGLSSADCASPDQRGLARSTPCDAGAFEYDYQGAYFVKPLSAGFANCESWANACTLQTALTHVPAGEIWVMEGLYKPGASRTDTFQLGAAAVYGGFSGTETARSQRDPVTNVTILSGDIDNNDVNSDGNNINETATDIAGNNSYQVVRGANGATLNGFTITAGNANLYGPDYGGGGGMFNYQSSPTVSKVIFSGNWGYFGGGMQNYQSSPTVMDVTFSGNAAMRGGGMENTDSSNPVVTNVTFSRNSATWGGGMDNYWNYSSPILTNVTFSCNLASDNGGGLNNDSGNPRIRNTILWNNTPNQIANINSSPTLTYSVVQGGCPTGSACSNIISNDPLLGTLGNYGGATPTIPLLPGSSAIDTGEAASCPATDQRGVARPQGSGCDIGAYEDDNAAPALTSFTRHDPATSSTNSDTLVFRATFNEDVRNVDTTDFIVSGSTATITDVTAVSGSAYDITVSGGDLPDLDGIVSIDLAPGQDITDIEGNVLLDGEPVTDETYLVSNAELYVVSFTRQSPAASPTNADVLVFRATFSAVAQYLHQTAFNVTGTTASVTLITEVNPSTYDITVAGGDLANLNGTVGLDLSPFSEISDLAGNLMPLVEPDIDELYEVDNTAPSLISFTRQNPLVSLTNSDTLTFRATFDEDVQNVDAVDFSVNGTTTATVTLVTPVTASDYDITISGGDLASFNGTVGLNLVASQNIIDLGGNSLPTGEPTTDETYLLDNTPPVLNSFTRQMPAASPTNADVLVFHATFSREVQDVDSSDFTVTGTTTSITLVTPVSASVYEITVSGGDLVSFNGIVGLNLATGQDIQDLVGNALPAGEPATDETYLVDNTPPALNSFNRQDPATSPTSADTLVFRATFDESVQNVDAVDFSVNGTTTATVTLVMPITASEYDITVSGGDLAGLNGTVGLDLAPGQTITDLGGNPLPAGEPPTDETYLVDNSTPTVTSILRQIPLTSPTNATSITFQVTFGEDVQNVGTADFGLTTIGSVTGRINAVNPISASIYDVGITEVGGDGVIDLNFYSANDITDLGSNPLGANPTIGSEQTYAIDNTFPTVLFGSNTIPVHNSALYISPTLIFVEFSENVVQDGSVEAADSLTNYLLVEAGGNDMFDTVSCSGGRVPDDRSITINSVNYSNKGGSGPFVATLGINNGNYLPPGSYQLYICGTTSIHDPAGNHLNDGTSDTLLNFTVVEVLPNTGFAPNRVTNLPVQPAEKSFTDLGGLWLEIPRLEVQIPIVGVPLSADGSWDVSWLGQNSGWLNGSTFPTYPGNSVLTGHAYDSYGNPGPFLQLNQLRYGDKVIVHIWGLQYVYEVREMMKVRPRSTSAMLKHQEEPWVTLMTCRGYDASTDLYDYRVLVRAVLIELK